MKNTNNPVTIPPRNISILIEKVDKKISLRQDRNDDFLKIYLRYGFIQIERTYRHAETLHITLHSEGAP